MKTQIEEKTRRIEELIENRKKNEKNQRLQEKLKTISSTRKSHDLQKDFFDLYAEFETIRNNVKKIQEKIDENSKNLSDLFNVNELLMDKHLGLKLQLERYSTLKISDSIKSKFEKMQKELRIDDNKIATFKVQALLKIKDLSLRLENSRIEEDRLSQKLEQLNQLSNKKSSLIGSLTERSQTKKPSFKDLYITESLSFI